MPLKITFCSLLIFINWLQNHLIPCPFKWLTGIDCPGCGFQRSVLALLKGNLQESFHLYPAAIPFLFTCTFIFASRRFNIDTRSHLIKKALFVITGNIMLVAYLVKMWN